MMAEHIGGDIEQGAKKTAQAAVSTARSVKNVKRAAAKAAAGNYVGAALDVLRDENMRKLIVFIVLFSFFLTLIIFFIVPLTLFEGIVGAINTLKSKWEAFWESFQVNLYSGTDGPFVRLLKATLGLTMDSDVERAFSDKSAGDQDQPNEGDLQLMGEQEPLIQTYARKIKAVQDKINARQKEVKQVIESSRGIQNVMAGRYESEYAHLYDDDPYSFISYAGTTISVSTRSVSANTAVKLITLYSTQVNSSVDNIKLSGLLRWLGYDNNSRKTIDFRVANNPVVTESIEAWTGTFLPQYLIDEGSQRNELAKYQKDYGCSVADFLIKVNCPNLYSIPATVTEEVVIEWEPYTKYSYLTWPVYFGAGSNPRYDANGYVIGGWNPSLYPDYARIYALGHDENGYSDNQYWFMPTKVGSSSPFTFCYYRTFWRPYTAYRQVEYHYYTVSYAVSASVSTRNIDQLVDMTGLWEGWLPSEDPAILHNKAKAAAGG